MGKRIPLVSIIIPVFNGADYIAQAIESALAQTYSNNEIIVVNDGSADCGATERAVRPFGDRVRYFAKENGGVATAFNYGIQQMSGEYFSWLSHDDLYKPEKIKSQMDLYDTLPRDTILYGGYEIFYDDNLRQTIPVRFETQYTNEELDTPLFPVFRGLANGCTTLFHKKHFDRVGLFDPALPTTQDYNLWFRMFRGAKVHYCPTTNVLMRQHAQQGSKVIPSHAEEASRLWIWMCQNATDAEKTSVSGSPYLFFRDLAKYLEETPYEEAKTFVLQQANIERQRWCSPPEDESLLLTYQLVKQVERRQALLDTPKPLQEQLPTHVFSHSNIRKFFIMAKNEGLKETLRKALFFIRQS